MFNRKTLGAVLAVTISLFGTHHAFSHGGADRFVNIAAKDKFERTTIANAGVSIEALRTDSVWGFATSAMVADLKAKGFKVLGDFDKTTARGGHESNFGLFDFPANDSKFHNYAETIAELRSMNSRHADITKLHVIGKTIEGRDIFAFQINTNPESLQTGQSGKPGAIFMGNHHAREHLSNEVPLMLAQYLLNNRADSRIATMLDGRDIWIIPMVNPDGVEWDISTGRYKMWRKNRRNNGDGTYGVDLNRNYGYKWGTGGSSNDTSSDVYMGKAPFSEPESQAIRDFVKARTNAKVLLTFHTFSELILYPWGNTYDAIGNARDLATFEKMAKTMSAWNRYTPQASSDLYIASGDTVDWAYGELGLFAFTFELSPRSQWEGGFYPGQGVIDRVFNDNIKPCLYLIDLADDPHRATAQNEPSGWLKNYHEPSIDSTLMWQVHPY